MLNEVWGKPEEEVRELADLEVRLKDFFAKHREVRQITEIEGLRQNAENGQKAIQLLETRLQEETAKHAKFDELSARIQVLEAENESLKDFVKTSASQEHRARKELREKHARDLAELNEKLEKSQGRTVTMISKNKALEAEAEAIDKLIFPSLGFEWTKDSNLSRTEAYDEARISIDKSVESSARGVASSLGHCRLTSPRSNLAAPAEPPGFDMAPSSRKLKGTSSSLSGEWTTRSGITSTIYPKDFPTLRRKQASQNFTGKDPGQATSIPGKALATAPKPDLATVMMAPIISNPKRSRSPVLEQ
ncbi:hypothetical protein QYE76_012030 [Lolium multiflorum]|uniref:Uncharacterized protein n=1 Tax=Lolium multiflorum TaxID=4521 RepID=A0AAD8U002_LOLMU|nr:hypothetical protein QYE76_012030 [Lolium multiflorum]